MRTTEAAASGTSARTGLQFTSIEEVSVTSSNRIHDAEGVAVTVGDEIELVVFGPSDRHPRYGRVLEVRATHPRDTIRPPAVIVGWNDNQRVGEIDAQTFESFGRILVSVAGVKTPVAAIAGTDVAVDEPDERELVPDFDEACEIVRECGGF